MNCPDVVLCLISMIFLLRIRNIWQFLGQYFQQVLLVTYWDRLDYIPTLNFVLKFCSENSVKTEFVEYIAKWNATYLLSSFPNFGTTCWKMKPGKFTEKGENTINMKEIFSFANHVHLQCRRTYWQRRIRKHMKQKYKKCPHAKHLHIKCYCTVWSMQ